jgi:hypothetical protein
VPYAHAEHDDNLLHEALCILRNVAT